MAIVLDKDLGSATGGGGTNTISFNTTNAVAAGGFIIVTVSGGGTSSSSVDGGGLSWSTDKTGFGSFGRQVTIASAQAPSGLAAGTTITATYDVNSAIRVIAGTSFTGVKTSSPVDGTPLGPTDTPSTTGWTTGSYAIAAGSMIVALIQNQANNSGNTAVAPSVEGCDVTTADPIDHVMEYRIEASSGSYTVEGTWGTAADATYIAVAYLAEPAAPPAGDTTTRRYQIRRSRMTSW